MTHRLFIPAVAALLALLAPGALAFEVDIQPTSVELPADPGARQRQSFTISNQGDEAVSMTIGLADWTLARDGALDLSAPGEATHSAAGWARFTPAFVELGPGESRSITVDIITPAILDHTGDYTIALLASTLARDPREPSLLRMQKVASLFYLTTPGAESAPAIRDVRLTRDEHGEPALGISLENSGNAHARLDGEILIEGIGPPVRIPVSNLVILAGGERHFAVPLDTALPERPRVTVTFADLFAPQAEGGAAPVRTYSAPL